MNAMKQGPERTCIGCRNLFGKHEVVRIVSGPMGLVIDYRGKMPGRAAYVCPKPDCIRKALAKDAVSRALRLKVGVPDADEFVSRLVDGVKKKIMSLIAMASKAGRLAAGFSAVQDALDKGKTELLIYAEDLSGGTKEKIELPVPRPRSTTLFTRGEFGEILNRELVGVIAIEDEGFADAIWKEIERLKGLINIGK